MGPQPPGEPRSPFAPPAYERDAYPSAYQDPYRSPYAEPQYPSYPDYPQYGAQPAAPYPAYPYPAYPYAPHQAYPAHLHYPPYVQQQPWPAAPAQRNHRWVTVLAVLLVAIGLVAAGVGAAHSTSTAVAGSGTTVDLPPATTPGGSGGTPSGGGASTPAPPTRSGAAPTTKVPGTTRPTAQQQVGVVTIVSVLSFQNAESAGTGMVIRPDGEILTNNHVINGATSITVTVQSTGRSYRADVVGTAPTQDVAVLKLRNASGLQTAALASTSSTVRVGDAVVGVGNAGGTGRLSAATGAVTALNQSITASDESGQEKERLNGLIQVNAPIISGDSGGPLYGPQGTIIGIDTAASSSRSTNRMAYAIPIDHARSIVRQIESGVQTATIHIGLPGFLGITSQAVAGGVQVQEVVTGGPAEKAGITPGSTITAVDGTSITSPQRLRTILTQKDPGDRVAVSWTTAGGAKVTRTVTLTSGPAD